MPRYKGGSQARSGFDITSSALPFTDINPRLINSSKYSDRLLKTEYTRMRDIAQKRLKRMQGSDVGASVLSQHPDGFPKIKDMKDRADLVHGLMEVTNFLTAKRSSISGIKQTAKQTKQAIKKSTGISVPKKQLGNYGRFINKLKKELGLDPGKYDAKYVVAAWSDLQNKGKITKKDLQKAVLGVMADLRQLDEPKKDKAKADRIAHNIDKYFDLDDLDKRTVSGLRKRKKRR